MQSNENRITAIRNGIGGARVVLYLDIPNAEYVAAGEPGDIVAALSREESVYIYRMLTYTWKVRDIDDYAASAVRWFLIAGIERQAFLRPLMETLATNTHLGRGGGRDPMHGVMDRMYAAERKDRQREEYEPIEDSEK